MRKNDYFFHVDLPEDLAFVRDELRLAAAVNLHRRGRLTLEDAARVAGLAPAGFVLALKRLCEPAATSTPLELPADVEATAFLDLIESIAKRPGMWGGSPSIADIGHFLNGFLHAVNLMGLPNPCEAWVRWVELRFGIFNTGWHWTRILRNAFGSDEAAVGALPELYRSYLRDRDELGAAGIEAKLRDELRANRICEDPEEAPAPRHDQASAISLAREEGETLGVARAVLTVLRARGIDVPGAVLDRILVEKDPATLQRWLSKAAIVATVSDMIGGDLE